MPVDNEMRPAILSTQAEDNNQLISNAVTNILNGTKVNIASDAFTASNILKLERSTQEKIGQQGMNGRIMGMPVIHTFELYTRGNQCILVYEKTGIEYPVEGLDCKAM